MNRRNRRPRIFSLQVAPAALRGAFEAPGLLPEPAQQVSPSQYCRDETRGGAAVRARRGTSGKSGLRADDGRQWSSKFVLWHGFVLVLSQDSSRRPSAGRRGRVVGGQQSSVWSVQDSETMCTLLTRAASRCLAMLKTEVYEPTWRTESHKKNCKTRKSWCASTKQIATSAACVKICRGSGLCSIDDHSISCSHKEQK